MPKSLIHIYLDNVRTYVPMADLTYGWPLSALSMTVFKLFKFMGLSPMTCLPTTPSPDKRMRRLKMSDGMGWDGVIELVWRKIRIYIVDLILK